MPPTWPNASNVPKVALLLHYYSSSYLVTLVYYKLNIPGPLKGLNRSQHPIAIDLRSNSKRQKGIGTERQIKATDTEMREYNEIYVKHSLKSNLSSESDER